MGPQQLTDMVHTLVHIDTPCTFRYAAPMLFKRKPREDGKSRSGGSDFWHCRIKVNGKLYQFSTKTTDKNKARGIEADFRVKKLKAEPTPFAAPTPQEFSKRFINDGIVGRVSKRTFGYYVFNWSVLVDSPLADIPLDKIGTAEIDQFISWRRKGKKISVVTINHNLRTLRRALHLAAEWGVIARVPKIKLLRGENQRDYVLTDEDVKRFESEKEIIGKLVPFLVDTGLRRGEACNLLWRDVNATGTEIHVTKGKTKFARRRIPLPARAAAILAELPRNGTHVFMRNKKAVTLDWISHEFLRARRRLNAPTDGETPEQVKARAIPDECVLHSTRHTFCTRLGEKGADAFAIQQLAGHSDIKISSRYVHPSARRLDSVMALLN